MSSKLQYASSHATNDGPTMDDQLGIPRMTVATTPKSFVGGLCHRPRVWNSLPPAIRDPSLSPSIFGKLLKTYLFV